MILNIPFFKNPDGYHCNEACIKSALKYFFPKKNYTWKELDKMTNHKGNATWFFSTAKVLHEQGLNITYYSEASETLSEFFNRLKKGDIRDEVEKDVAEHSVEGLRLAKYLEKNKLVKYEDSNINLIRRELNAGKILITIINFYQLYPKCRWEEGEPLLHVVLITGIDDENIYFHESDPYCAQTHKKVSISEFERVWKLGNKFGEVIVVSKK